MASKRGCAKKINKKYFKQEHYTGRRPTPAGHLQYSVSDFWTFAVLLPRVLRYLYSAKVFCLNPVHINTSLGFGQNVGLPTVWLFSQKNSSIPIIQGFLCIFLARWPRGEFLYGGVFGVQIKCFGQTFSSNSQLHVLLGCICWYQNKQIPITGNGNASTRIGMSMGTGILFESITRTVLNYRVPIRANYQFQ